MNIHAVDAVKTELTVKAEQTRMLFRQGVPVQLFGLGAAALAVGILSDVVKLSTLIAWFTAFILLTAARFLMAHRFSQVPETELEVGSWAKLYILGTFASGVLWGVLSLFYEPVWPVAHQVALFIIYTGVIASGFNTNSSVKFAYPAFFLPPVVMLMYVILSHTSSVEMFGALALLFCIYMAQLAISSNRYYRGMSDALRMRVVNEMLAGALDESNKRLKILAERDELTHLYNRRSMERFLKEEWERHIRSAVPFSMLYVDIDYFKQYNDTYGHLEGDDVLEQVAAVLQMDAQRATDMAARFGGEEFAVMLPGTEHHDALKIAERIRSDVESLQIAHTGSRIADTVTVSIGLATITPLPGMTLEIFKREADRALYMAKDQGRNRVVGSISE